MEESGLVGSATPFMDTVGASSPTPETTLFNSFDDYSSVPGTESGPTIESATESSYSIWSVISFILIILIVWVLIFNFFNLGKVTDRKKRPEHKTKNKPKLRHFIRHHLTRPMFKKQKNLQFYPKGWQI